MAEHSWEDPDIEDGKETDYHTDFFLLKFFLIPEHPDSSMANCLTAAWRRWPSHSLALFPRWEK